MNPFNLLPRLGRRKQTKHNPYGFEDYYGQRFRNNLCRGISPDSIRADIEELQEHLIEKGWPLEVTGNFDEATEAAVKDIQRKNDLCEDGRVGAYTWAALLYPTLRRDDYSEDVKNLQRLLNREVLGMHVAADGLFGPQTEKSAKNFQRSQRLQPDGIFGPATWACLVGERPERRKAATGLSWRLPVPPLQMVQQILIILLIAAGIYFSPLDKIDAFTWATSADPLVRSYALVCVVSIVKKKLLINILDLEQFFLLKFSPYFLVGFLHEQIFDWLMLPSQLGN